MAYLSACWAIFGMCSHSWMPGTLVGMGLKMPRVSLGPSGFISKVSIWGGPPLSQTRITERCGLDSLPTWAAVPSARAFAAKKSRRPRPKSPSDPILMKSLRPNSSFGT